MRRYVYYFSMFAARRLFSLSLSPAPREARNRLLHTPSARLLLSDGRARLWRLRKSRQLHEMHNSIVFDSVRFLSVLQYSYAFPLFPATANTSHCIWECSSDAHISFSAFRTIEVRARCPCILWPTRNTMEHPINSTYSSFDFSLRLRFAGLFAICWILLVSDVGVVCVSDAQFATNDASDSFTENENCKTRNYNITDR